MAYFIFQKNLDNINNTLYRIAENQSDYNNLNIDPSNYKVIEDSQTNFEAVKYSTKFARGYNGNVINYENITQPGLPNKEIFLTSLNGIKLAINVFLKENPNHPLYSRWSNYLSQLNNLNVDSLTFPMSISLETYFNNQGLTSLIPLQLP
jgi:hypothetical protein